jgi:hypothetical protein
MLFKNAAHPITAVSVFKFFRELSLQHIVHQLFRLARNVLHFIAAMHLREKCRIRLASEDGEARN